MSNDPSKTNMTRVSTSTNAATSNTNNLNSSSNPHTLNNNNNDNNDNIIAFSKAKTTQAYKNRKLNRIRKSFEDFLPIEALTAKATKKAYRKKKTKR